MGRLIGAALRILIIIPIFLLLWFCFGTGMLSFLVDGSFLYGFILIPMFGLFFLLRKMKFGLLANAVLAVSVLVVLPTAIGFIHPNLWKGGKKSIRATTHGMGERLTESAIQSTQYSYNMAKLTEGVIYLDIYTIAVFLEDGKDRIFPEDTEVRVLSLEPVLGGKDGTVHLIPVMLMDKRRKDYVDGPRGWVPTARLKFDHRFPGISFAKKEKEAAKWGPEIVKEVSFNDPAWQPIDLKDGRYKAWVEWRTRYQLTDQKKSRGGRLQEVYPNGYFPGLGRSFQDPRFAKYQPLPEAPTWAVVLKRNGSDRGIIFGQKPIEIDVAGGAAANLNCSQVAMVEYPFDPSLNWIRNNGTVTFHFQPQLL